MHPKLKSILKYLAPVLIVVALYAIVNGVAFGVQKIANRDDQKKLDSLTSQIDTQEKTLNDLDKKITAEEAQLTALDKKITDEEETADDETYNNDVAAYNKLVDLYKADIDAYNKQIPAYNAKVTEANELAKKVGSTWYVVPLPTNKH
ncbi:MAG: hypothetical protein JWM37_923 [Candidatus Saccharibacteria bacterium]|nr:hypothetical protein [Candidatus Saccharibacteria bacterium]